MCGRFTLHTSMAEWLTLFLPGFEQEDDQAPRYNIAPTQSVSAIRHDDDARRALVRLRWGLLPSWAKDTKIAATMINARSETITEKPSFRTAIRKRRCLVIADGYYEWQQLGPREKQPYYIHRPDHQPFAMAGIWERNEQAAVDRQPIESCAILTTASQGSIASIHDRMPVILTADRWDLWLDRAFNDPAPLLEWLAPVAEGTLATTKVSKWVNSPTHDDATCCAPLV
jgi:putative SOS response-associated peptidase YedK